MFRFILSSAICKCSNFRVPWLIIIIIYFSFELLSLWYAKNVFKFAVEIFFILIVLGYFLALCTTIAKYLLHFLFIFLLVGLQFSLLICKHSLFKFLGKTTRPFRYDLNQIPCDCTVEVTNRFKGLDLIDRVPEELWMEVCNVVQQAVTKTIPKKKKYKKAK